MRIAGYVHEEGKASVLIVNKWDLIEKDTYTAEKFKKKMLVDLAFMSYVPMLFISAKTGQRVNKVMELAEFAYEQNCTRISTGKLNDIISEAVTARECRKTSACVLFHPSRHQAADIYYFCE